MLCISKINNTLIDNAEDLDSYIYVTFVIISDNYSRASVRFFNYSRDEIFDNAN